VDRVITHQIVTPLLRSRRAAWQDFSDGHSLSDTRPRQMLRVVPLCLTLSGE
jgi:hypothetical protein